MDALSEILIAFGHATKPLLKEEKPRASRLQENPLAIGKPQAWFTGDDGERPRRIEKNRKDV